MQGSWQGFGNLKQQSQHPQTVAEKNECLLACAWLIFSIHAFQLRTPWLENGATHRGLCLPISVNSRQSPTDMPTRCRQSPSETLFLSDSRCVKLTMQTITPTLEASGLFLLLLVFETLSFWIQSLNLKNLS